MTTTNNNNTVRYAYIDESKALNLYREYVNGMASGFSFGDIQFEPSYILEELSPIAFQCGFNEWLDANRLTTYGDDEVGA